jgi:nicotinate phosphoribosyltransferase
MDHQSLLTDLYQLTISKINWEHGRSDDHAVFDLFFRTNPFEGNFTVFAGLSDAVNFLQNFRFSEDELAYIQSKIANCPSGFIDYLRTLDGPL